MKTTIHNNKTSDDIAVTLRWAGPEQLGDVVKLEKLGSEDLWPAGMLLEYLEQKEGSRRCFIAWLAGLRPVGLLCLKARETDNAVVKLVVAPSCRRKGIGSMMLSALETKLRKRPELFRPQVSTVVREYDLGAQLFLKANGYRWQRTLSPWFDCPPEDGYFFTRELCP